jgi:hypothetical protein
MNEPTSATADKRPSESGCSDSFVLFDGYPIIATIDTTEIGAPWKLVAHRNGPAMTNGEIISVIDPHKDDTPRAAELKRRAVRLYREWSWPKLVGEFYPNVADRSPRPPASGGASSESALMVGAVAPASEADGIRHDDRARTRPIINAVRVGGTPHPERAGSGLLESKGE